MTYAGKIEMAMELFEQGMLCKCSKTKPIVHTDMSNGNEYETKEILHDEDCEGKLKALELIGYKRG